MQIEKKERNNFELAWEEYPQVRAPRGVILVLVEILEGGWFY